MLETIGCAHDLCNCTVLAEIGSEKYCSDTCQSTVEDAIESEVCNCGHPPCDTP